MPSKGDLYNTIDELRTQLDMVYYQRNLALAVIAQCKEPDRVGMAEDADPDCPKGWRTVLYLEYGNDQISFHIPDHDVWMFRRIPAYEGKWDGHDVQEKNRRMEKLIL